MTIYEYEKATVERFIERWKESGYEIEYNVIKGGKPTERFINAIIRAAAEEIAAGSM